LCENPKVHAEVGFGEEIYLCGNVPALGCDTVSRAIPLVTSTDDFPWWQTKEGEFNKYPRFSFPFYLRVFNGLGIFLPGDAGSVTYRYCVFAGGTFSRWESGANWSRSLDVTHCKSLVKETEDFLGETKHMSGDMDVTSTPRKVATTAASEAHLHAAKMLQAWSRSLANSDLSSQDGVIIVSYFLPVILSRRNNGKWTAVWDKEALLSLQIDVRLMWIGSVRYGNAPIPTDEEEAVASVLADMNCYPVFLNQSAHHKFYDIFCKQSLWLVMHHIADVYGPQNRQDKSVKAQESLWFNYSTVHNAFREKVLEVFQQGYLIWIHGFHLMLLPSFLRRRIPQAKIGYFFHTPFPSSEIWRTMSHREDLLRGILGADQIGFHLFEYARHFVTICHRLLGCNSETNAGGMMIINVDGREVALSCIHVGVDLPRLTEIFQTEIFASEVMQWKRKFPGRVIVSGIDRLERLKGIPLRLMALDEFLEENPVWLGKVVFPFIGISAGERGEDYRQTQHDVQILIKKLNDKYAHCGYDMFYFEERHDRDCRLAQRLAFFAAADILLMTAIRYCFFSPFVDYVHIAKFIWSTETA
jgi:trehalose-6-phosphate synthase